MCKDRMYKDRMEHLGYLLYQVMEGDVPDGIYEILHQYGLVDDSHEWIYGDEDED